MQSFPRFGLSRINAQRLLELTGGPVTVLLGGENDTEIRMGIGALGIDLENMFELADRLLQLSLTYQPHCQVVARVHVVRVALERKMVLRKRLRRPAKLGQDDPEVIVDDRIVFLQSQSTAQKLLGLCEAPETLQASAYLGNHLEVVWNHGVAAPEQPQGFFVAPESAEDRAQLKNDIRILRIELERAP